MALDGQRHALAGQQTADLVPDGFEDAFGRVGNEGWFGAFLLLSVWQAGEITVTVGVGGGVGEGEMVQRKKGMGERVPFYR